MKNLKKVLALVLALATVMGLGVTASAKEYTDSSKIEYTEAVDVMSAIGVLSGNPDGSFNPQGNLTRAQAAKMVAYLLNSGKDVNDLYAGSCQFTDCYSNWARGYIAYAAQTGIVSGVGNGKFNPNGTLTGVQLAKMMLTSLGYDADAEGYQNNNNWQVNIINDAQSAGLLKGMSNVNLYTAITREQASQMMFNALKATMVKYDNRGSEIILPGGGSIITNPSSAEEVANNDSSYTVEGKVATDFKGTMELCEKYFPTLKLVADDYDVVGRPASMWKYEGDEVVASVNDALVTYTSTQKAADIAKDLKGYKWGKTAIDNTTDTDTQFSYTENNDNTKKTAASSSTLAEKLEALTGNGVAVEIYANEDKEISVVVVNTTLTTVSTKITTSGKESITLKGCTKITLEDNETLYNKLKDFSVDDNVLVIKDSSNKVLEVVGAPTTVSGTYTRKSGSTYTIDGNTYEAAKNVDMSAVSKLGNSYDLVLDQYGYVVKAEATAGESTDYAFVAAVEEEGNLISGKTVMAQLVFADGTKSWVKVDEFNSKDVDAKGDLSSADKKFVSYVKNSDDSYDLKTTNLTTTAYESKDQGSTGVDSGDVTYTITKGKVQFLDEYTYSSDWGTATAKDVKGSSKTPFVYNVDDKLTAYTGIANAPSTTKSLSTTIYTLTKDGALEMVYVVTNELSGVSTSDLVYITDKNPDYVYVDAETDAYYEFEAIVNGEVTTVKAKKDNTFNATGLFEVTKYDSNGYAEDASKVTEKDQFVVPATQNAITVKDGVITVDTNEYYVLAEKYTIYVIDADGGVVTMDADAVAGLDVTGIVMVGNLDKDDEIVDVAEIYLTIK